MLVNAIIEVLSPGVAVLSLLMILLAMEVIWIIYARKFHPLAGIPGPWLASVSRLWVILKLHGGDMDIQQRQLHKTYGYLVRIAPNEIACSDPEAIQKLYRAQNPLTKTDFYPVWGSRVISKYPDNFSGVDERLHSQRRRIVNHVYSLSNVLQSEARIDRCTLILVDMFTRIAQNTDICDLGTWLQWYTFDVIGELFFGRMFGFLEKEEDHQMWIASLDDLMRGFCIVAVAPTYMRAIIFMSSLFDQTMRRALRGAATIVSAARKAVNDREADLSVNDEGKVQQDLLQQLLHIHHEKGERVDFGIHEVQQESYVALLAGSDTTAIAFRSVFYYLMKHRDVCRRLQAEIDSAAAWGNLSYPVQYAEAIKLPFLCACIKEALRVHPSVALTMPRLTPPGGMELNGKYIPEGYRVGVNAAVVHFDRRIFGPDADEYRPSRWLEPSAAARMEKYMIHFGGGTRTCIGKS
ncbi:hypothetical protein DV736_g6662, partial [Chaetothyriales sp. CBS 134916]